MAMIRDLRDWLDQVGEIGELIHIPVEVDWDLDWWKKSKPCQVAAVYGLDPLLFSTDCGVR